MTWKSLQGQKLEAIGANSAGSSDKSGEATKVFDFWGVANALADTVKKTTADISTRYSASSLSSIPACETPPIISIRDLAFNK